MRSSESRAWGVAVALSNRLNNHLRRKRQQTPNWIPVNKALSLVGDRGPIKHYYPELDVGPYRDLSDAYVLFNGIKWIPYVPDILYDSAFSFYTVNSIWSVPYDQSHGSYPCCVVYPGTSAGSMIVGQWGYTSFDLNIIILNNLKGKREDIKLLNYKEILSSHTVTTDWFRWGCGDAPGSDYCYTGHSSADDSHTNYFVSVTTNEILEAFGSNTPKYNTLKKLLDGLNVVTLSSSKNEFFSTEYGHNVHSPGVHMSSTAAGRSLPVHIYPEDGPEVEPKVKPAGNHIFTKGLFNSNTGLFYNVSGSRKKDSVVVELPRSEDLVYHPEIRAAWSRAYIFDAFGATTPAFLNIYL